MLLGSSIGTRGRLGDGPGSVVMGIVDRTGSVRIPATGALICSSGTRTGPIRGPLRLVIMRIILRSGGIRGTAGTGICLNRSGTLAV